MNDENGKKKARAARHVFTVVDRGGKSYWIRIGAAFGNYDGSETVLLDALPLNGKMQIRDPGTKEVTPKAKAGVPSAAVQDAADDDGD
ncbi:MAG TPA: hypothetical protein VLY20_05565 [Nitrospiria bacterium]|nr:hypothetical protein [Nitrospiria bacterium]